MTTTVRGYIAEHGPSTAWARVTELAQEHAGFLMILRRARFPECLADACEDLKLFTVADVENFNNTCSLTMEQVNGLFPTVDLPKTVPVTAKLIHLHATQQFRLTSRSNGDPADFSITHNDAEYSPVPESTALALAQAFPWRSAEFYKTNDCEDLVTLFRGWLLQQGYLKTAVGMAGLDLYWLNSWAGAHAVPFIYTDTGKFLLVDAGHTYPAKQSQFAGVENATTSKLRVLVL